MLCRLRCLSGFPVSCGDELILSTSLLPADRALTMKCWLNFILLVSCWYLNPCEIRDPVPFAGLDSVCTYSEQWLDLQEEVIWVAKMEGKKQKYFPFSTENLRQRVERSSLP